MENYDEQCCQLQTMLNDAEGFDDDYAIWKYYSTKDPIGSNFYVASHGGGFEHFMEIIEANAQAMSHRNFWIGTAVGAGVIGISTIAALIWDAKRQKQKTVVLRVPGKNE